MAQLPDFEGWAVFAKVAALGSFVGAAAELGLSTATVSKAITRLERRLGTRLFHRTSRKLALTESGRTLASRAAQVLADATAMEAEGAAQSTVPRGRVRMTAPMSFGLQHLTPVLPDFLASYPAITIDLHLSDQLVDLVGEGFDVALRIADLPDSRMVARRLCQVRRVLVAAPAYLAARGRPTHPRELAQHACLGYAYLPSAGTWRFRGPKGAEAAVEVSGPLCANNAEALLPALKAGLGLALQPAFVVWRDIADGRLETVMDAWEAPPIALHTVTPPGGPRPSKVTALIDFLAARFAENAAPWARRAGA